MLNMLAFIFLNSTSHAACPSNVVIEDTLTCSNEISGFVDHTASSFLGGDCDSDDCYTCGQPHSSEEQIAPETVYSFHCQVNGEARLEITDLPCDLDIYVLNGSCDPYTGCLQGSTSAFDVNDSVVFECSPGQTYYIVVEAYGAAHFDVASGPCTDDGTATGNPFSPTYTLKFDLGESTACSEDCDDGIDNDLDVQTDCDDMDCWTDPVCCDLDGDGFFAQDCNGDDCDDLNPSVHPEASEDGGSGDSLGDGIDNDCDGTTDNGTLDFDDDGDGLSENDGDCDDTNAMINPDSQEILDNDIDEDCDGENNTSSLEGLEGSKESSQSGCSCSTTQKSPATGTFLLLMMLVGEAWRRRQS